MSVFTRIKEHFQKDIILEKVAGKSVQLAKESCQEVEFISVSNEQKTRKKYNVDMKEMAEMVNTILGDIIEIRVEHMILEEIVMKHGEKNMLEAYDRYQAEAGKAVKAYFEELASIKSGNEREVLQ